MALFKNGRVVEDRWRTLPDGEAAPMSGHVIFPYQWWLEERGAFEGSNAPLGLRIEPDSKLEEIAADIKRFSLIALVFPKFGDGRAFSLARLLRNRYGFTGELRATGEILLDEIQLMQRCGFDAFDVSDQNTQKALREGIVPGVDHFYQPSNRAEQTAGGRPWTRRAKSANTPPDA